MAAVRLKNVEYSKLYDSVQVITKIIKGAKNWLNIMDQQINYLETMVLRIYQTEN